MLRWLLAVVFAPEDLKGVLALRRQGLSPTERHDSRARARSIYESLKATLAPSFRGKILAIKVASGEHFIGETVLETGMKARQASR
jgi:hypothetical protein